MLDFDLAELYEVETKTLNQAIRRNPERFPSDFMFQLTEFEQQNLMRSQIVTASRTNANRRFRSFAFTELGIAMLSGVLKTHQAIQVHISIIRVFFKLRELLHSNREFAEKLETIEKSSNHLFKVVFERLESLENPTDLEKPEKWVPPTRRIGI